MSSSASVAETVAVLAGGVGAARFLEGLIQVVPSRQVTAIVNTGDDIDFYGLRVSPDVDIVMYTLAGLVNVEQGWGVTGDTFALQEMLACYGEETWFRLGDRDLATHVLRTRLLREGLSPSQVAARLAMMLGLEMRLLPMTDDHFRTRVRTPGGVLPFQEYFVKRRQQDDVLGIEFEGADAARPAPGVLEALRTARAVVFAPSNPYVSIGPILSLPGVRETLRERRERIVAISPIVGGAAIKGPAANMLRTLGMEVSAAGVAALYRDVVGTFILDEIDAELAPRIASLGMRPVVTQTMMLGPAEKRDLAARALEALP